MKDGWQATEPQIGSGFKVLVTEEDVAEARKDLTRGDGLEFAYQ